MNLFVLFAVIVISITKSAYAEIKPLVIYGKDNRKDIFEVKDYRVLKNSKAIATRVHKSDYKVETHWFNYANFLDVNKLGSPFGEGLCSDEKFVEQETLGDCTGFLIKKDILVTAAHCVADFDGVVENKSNANCKGMRWVFNFEKRSSKSKSAIRNTDLHAYPLDDIYSCKKIIYSKRSSKRDENDNFLNYMDYAVIKLDREVKNATVLKLSKENTRVGTKVYSIGHPSGLPKKVTNNAKVLKNDSSKSIFETNLDSFSGSSGSPVFNAKTHEVVGILVAGREDYFFDEVNDCYRTNKCTASGSYCMGQPQDEPTESATKIEYINDLKL